MRALKIDHIGIVVRDVKERLKLYEGLLGLKVDHVEELPERGIRVHFIELGETRFELLEEISPDSEIHSFLEKRGEGIHHLAIRVEGIEEMVKRAKELGLKPLSDEPRKGAHGTRVVFIHPKTTGGILLELVEGGNG